MRGICHRGSTFVNAKNEGTATRYSSNLSVDGRNGGLPEHVNMIYTLLMSLDLKEGKAQRLLLLEPSEWESPSSKLSSLMLMEGWSG